MNRHTLSLRPLSLAILAGFGIAASNAAHAGDEDTPLYLSLAHTITRDSNFSRNDDRQGETINTTAVQAGIDKAYGRQTYTGSARLTKSTYAHYGDQLNNDGKSINGAISSEFLRDWKVTVGGDYDENLNQIQENNDASARVVRNIRTYRDGNVGLRYGIGGRYAIGLNYDANRLSYSATRYQYNNANQHTQGVNGTYYSSDLLNFGLGYRLVRTRYPNRADDTQTDHDIDLTTNWQVTGLSNLNARLTRTSSSFTNDADRSVSGWTSAVSWAYTPAGLVTYGVNFVRATGADRTQMNWLGSSSGQVVDIQQISNNNVTTSLALSAKAQLTGKTSVTANYSLSRYTVDNRSTETLGSNFGSTVDKSSSFSHVASISANYAATRSLSFGCSYQKFSQTEGATRIGFDGHAVDCTASFTID